MRQTSSCVSREEKNSGKCLMIQEPQGNQGKCLRGCSAPLVALKAVLSTPRPQAAPPSLGFPSQQNPSAPVSNVTEYTPLGRPFLRLHAPKTGEIKRCEKMGTPPLLERPPWISDHTALEWTWENLVLVSLNMTVLTLIQCIANCVTTHFWVVKWNEWVPASILYCFVKYLLCGCVCAFSVSAWRPQCKCFSSLDCSHWPERSIKPSQCLPHLIPRGDGVLIVHSASP